MGNAAAKEVAKINVESALAFLAEKHSATQAQILEGLLAGHILLTESFQALLQVGLNESLVFLNK